MWPVHGLFIGAIKCFRDTDAKFSRFHRHWRWRWKAGEEQWWWWWWWWWRRKREEGIGDDGGGGWWSQVLRDRKGGREVMGEHMGFVFFLGS